MSPSEAQATVVVPAPLTLEPLRPRPVSGHLQRVKRQSGDRWRVKWRDAAGVEHLKVLGRVHASRGRAGHLTRQEAQRQLDEILAEARRVGPGARRAVGAQPTFADAAREWLRYVEVDRRRRPSTLRDYRHVVERALVPAFGGLGLRDVTAEMIDSYRNALVDEGRLSPRSINKYLLVLHAIFRRAQRQWGLTVNPAAGVERQPVRRSRDFRVLSPEQVSALVRATATGAHHRPAKRELTVAELHARRVQDEQDAAIFTTAAFAGLRLGELRALRWRDVDFDLRVVHVRRSYSGASEDVPKSGRVRAVPMVDQVARTLEDLSRRERVVAPGDLVFPGPEGEFMDDSALRRRYYAALEAAGVGHLRFHDLRHTFGTLAVQEFPLSDVKAYMGHADIATTMIYVHHVPQHDAADRLSQRLAKASTAAALLDAAEHTPTA